MFGGVGLDLHASTVFQFQSIWTWLVDSLGFGMR